MLMKLIDLQVNRDRWFPVKLEFEFFTLAVSSLPPKIQMSQYCGNLIPDKEQKKAPLSEKIILSPIKVTV